METAKIYLCKADCSILGSIAGLKPETCSLKKSATDLWEFTFEVNRYIEEGGALVQSSYYDSIHEMMKLYFDIGEEQLFFMIDSEPVIRGEGIQETKTVTAHSIECELCNIYLNNFKINCGTSDSQEYLACETDENGIINYYNVNPYTGLPNEYISLVNYNNPQLSLLHLALQGTGWSVKPDIDPGICRIKRSCDIQSNNVYTFLMNVVSPSASIIFEFDRKHRQIGAVTMENYGEDTGIFVSMRNLVNSFEISSSSDDTMKTKIIPSGADNLGIEYVNFGSDYIINLDYFMNTVNEYGDYQYVSKELHDKYNLWKNYRETEKETFQDKQYTRRELYIELTKLYNQTLLDISELKNRVPNDGVVTDYKTFSLEELKLHLNAYNKALAALITIYKNEYGVTEDLGDAPGYMPTPSTATNIKDTPYWHDFYAYKESIIPQIKEALKMYCQTGSNGNLVTDNGYFIELEYGNPAYYADPSIVKEVDAYQYEWSLYGLEELEAKKKAWLEVSNLLFNECFIQSGTSVSPDAYRTPDDAGWNSLSDTQRKEFTSKSAYIDKLNQYLDYMSFDERDNSLTKTKCKGVIRQCDEAIILCKNKIASIENLQNEYQIQRKKLANSVDIEKFKVNDTLLFTEKDLNIINSMIREQDYNNSNIITTNLDDIVTSIDAQKELYQAAVEELYKLSRPQYSFSATIDNLYALEEFQCFHDDFKVGNFIRVGLELHEELCDANFIKLRVISITHNPIMPDENLSVEFSTMTKSLAGLNDLDFLLSKSSSGGSSSGSSSSSSGGTYGNNDANVQMSNNMLNALLSTELFGTAVTDVILDSIQANRGNFNTLLSHSGVFDSLEAGQIKVSGDCLFDRIKSGNWNGSENNLLGNTQGSILDLADGKFSFAGGKLKWDGEELSVDGNGKFTGDIDARSLTLSKNASISGLSSSNLSDGDSFILKDVEIGTQNSDNHDSNFIKISKNGLLEADNAIIHGTIYASDGIFNGTVYASDGKFKGDIIASSLTLNEKASVSGLSSTNLSDSMSIILKDTGIGSQDMENHSTNFIKISKNGLLEADNAIIHGTIYASDGKFDKGTIGGFSLSDNFLTSADNDKSYGVGIYTGSYNKNQNVIINDSSYCGFWAGHYIPEYAPINITQDGKILINDDINTREFEDIISPYSIDTINHMKNHFSVFSKLYGGKTELSLLCNGICINANDGHEQSAYTKILPGSVVYNYKLEKTDKIYKDEDHEYKTTVDSNGIYIYHIYEKNYVTMGHDYFIASYNQLQSTAAYTETSFSGLNKRTLYVGSDGTISAASSSRRYKRDISSKLDEYFNPHKIYDLPVCQFRYNAENGGGKNSQLYIGFIAEDVAKYYPPAARWNKEHTEVDTWEIADMFPAVVKLIQEQHEEIETMKEQFQELKSHIFE